MMQKDNKNANLTQTNQRNRVNVLYWREAWRALLRGDLERTRRWRRRSDVCCRSELKEEKERREGRSDQKPRDRTAERAAILASKSQKLWLQRLEECQDATFIFFFSCFFENPTLDGFWFYLKFKTDKTFQISTKSSTHKTESEDHIIINKRKRESFLSKQIKLIEIYWDAITRTLKLI